MEGSRDVLRERGVEWASVTRSAWPCVTMEGGGVTDATCTSKPVATSLRSLSLQVQGEGLLGAGCFSHIWPFSSILFIYCEVHQDHTWHVFTFSIAGEMGLFLASCRYRCEHSCTLLAHRLHISVGRQAAVSGQLSPLKNYEGSRRTFGYVDFSVLIFIILAIKTDNFLTYLFIYNNPLYIDIVTIFYETYLYFPK